MKEDTVLLWRGVLTTLGMGRFITRGGITNVLVTVVVGLVVVAHASASNARHSRGSGGGGNSGNNQPFHRTTTVVSLRSNMLEPRLSRGPNSQNH